jgi:hypothetical protein
MIKEPDMRNLDFAPARERQAFMVRRTAGRKRSAQASIKAGQWVERLTNVASQNGQIRRRSPGF